MFRWSWFKNQEKQRELKLADALVDFLTWSGRVEWEHVRTMNRVQLPNGCEVVITIKD